MIVTELTPSVEATSLADNFLTTWRLRLQADLPYQPLIHREAILRWLLRDTLKHLETLTSVQFAELQSSMDYRYRILVQRYLGVSSEQAYRRLIQRFSTILLIRNKIHIWVAQSRDRHRSVMDVLQETLQDIIQSDQYIRQQLILIAECTLNRTLRNLFLLSDLEEYCLRPVRKQPLLLYRISNYLRRSQRGGITQLPVGSLIKLLSDEIPSDGTDEPINYLDEVAIAQYQTEQLWREQQILRTAVKETFLTYLEQEVDPLAAQWLELHLQGQPQETIARMMGLPANRIYRLREKVCYHAIRLFMLKRELELVTTWLGISKSESDAEKN